jgi:AraC family transcriptional regulator of adaptative response/methylated-DNA-[protein]-cysteine methyltransferase
MSQQLARPSDTLAEADSRWRALATRDFSGIEPFLLGVITTGIYCRSGCPSRTPLRRNVRFFDTRQEAERAGFRPCRRCRPELDTTPNRGKEAVAKARSQLDHAAEPIALTALAAMVELSPSHLQRIFSQEIGMSPKAYADTLRLQRVQDQLSAGQPVTRAIYEAGFGSSSRFYDTEAQTLGMPPATYRTGGTGVVIHYAVVPSTYGQMLLASTERGLCAVAFGDSSPELVEQLQTRFSKATVTSDDPAFTEWFGHIAAALEHPAALSDLPLDIQGTAFQRRVWKALRDIPPGATISYGELAKRIGQPGSARAVAGACAANTLAVVIPCHRVVRENGDPGGYRWGVNRKQALLTAEAG